MSDKLRSQYARDLTFLYEILAKNGIIKDLNPLSRSIAKCYDHPRGNTDLWKHEIYKLNFGPIQSLKKIRPENVKETNLLLSVLCIGQFLDDPQHDTINELKFDIRINAQNTENKKFITSWHLDCHIIQEDDGEPDHCHPLFHFQHGGRAILGLYEDQNYDFGSSLFLESPRIAYPPMDIILGVNFVLSQFYGDKWKKLTKQRTYLRLVQASQERLWKPYFSKLASYFDAPHQHEPAKVLMPDLFF